MKNIGKIRKECKQTNKKPAFSNSKIKLSHKTGILFLWDFQDIS